MTRFTHHPSPIGPLLLVSDGDGAGDGDGDGAGPTVLTGLYMEAHRRGPVVDPAWTEDPAAFAAVVAQLDEYFAGSRSVFELQLGPRGTDFQRRVWDELTRIPAGETISYGELAARVGRPNAARAVGAAVGRNPISIIVPCHRVVGSNGALTGYAGGVERKAHLLALEGARPLTTSVAVTAAAAVTATAAAQATGH
jgi:methylated-DNA-[protein]-cysteine S-methyltransferase